jgi:hypothetical protein
MLLFILPLESLLYAQSDSKIPGLTLDQVKALFDEVSGEAAWNSICHLSLLHRWFVSDGYHVAAEYMRNQAKAIGLRNVEIEGFYSDGKAYYSTQKSLPKWSVKSASLELVSPLKKRLVAWEENPIVLASNSRSANVTAELVDVGQGVSPADYKDKAVAGKLVLASSPQDSGRIEQVHRLAVLERGAAGVVSYRGYEYDDFPDLITWDHIWTLELNGKLSTFGFCIPKRMGWQLKRLLASGDTVVLHAEIHAELSAGQLEIVKGSIPGTDLAAQEIWFVAHLDHTRPSANDNASGSAAILEAARTLTRLFESGILPPPRRTIRFFWVPEIYGSYAYVSKHLDEAKKAVAVINMDMVGENQELCGSTFRITRTPDSTSSYLNDLLESCLGFMLAHGFNRDDINEDLQNAFAGISPFGSRDNWKAEMIPYSGGSDHAVFMGGVINIPATMFGSWPDYFYHSSGDTPDKSDPTQLKRAIVCGALAAASLATMNGQTGLSYLQTMASFGSQRLDQAAGNAFEFLESSELRGEDLKEALNILQQRALRETEALGSIQLLLPNDAMVLSRVDQLRADTQSHLDLATAHIRNYYTHLCQIKGIKPESVELTDGEKMATTLVPLRNSAFPGNIDGEYIAMRLEDKRLPAVQTRLSGLQRYEVAAFINGQRNILEIRNAVSAETRPAKLSDVISYIKMLESIDLVSIQQPISRH